MPPHASLSWSTNAAMVITWTEENVAHLLRRTGFGAHPDDIQEALNNNPATVVAGLFKPWKKSDQFGPFKNAWLEDLQLWWIRRMLQSSSPLIEKLTLFWHNHFATGFHKLESPKWMHQQNRTLRKHCLGRFRDLLGAIARDGAMLIWLDNASNIAADPNENWARELMELFTTGVFDKDGNPNYTESDVQEAARAFTGWTVKYPSGKFKFDVDNHDFGDKTFKGLSGPLDGQDVLDLLATEDATARRLAAKLFAFFAYEVDLDDPVLDPLVAAYFDHDTGIRAMLEVLFLMDEFYSDQARRAHVKSPCEFLVGSLRMLDGKLLKKASAYDIGHMLADLGQSIFDPPSVFGWKEGAAWLSSNRVMSRLTISARIAAARKGYGEPFLWNPAALPGKPKNWDQIDAAQLVELLDARLGPVGLSSSSSALLENYLGQDESGVAGPFTLDADSIDGKLRGAVALLLSSPEYQFA